MYKLFSIDQANSLIPRADEKIEELRSAAADLRNITGNLRRVKPFTMEARNLYFESAFLAQQIRTIKEELTEMGLQVADPESGKLGFPGLIGAELVYLTWESGEKKVSHFRRLAGGNTQAIPINRAEPAPQVSAAA